MAITEADPSIEALELAGFASWPAEKVCEDGTWLIRLSPKLPYKRTNSINCLNHEDGTRAGERLLHAQTIFKATNVQPTLRTTPLTPPALLAATSGTDWTAPFSESIVMTAQVSSPESPNSPIGFQSFDHPVPQWIEDYMALTMDKTKDRETISRTLNEIEQPVRFIRVVQADVCKGIAVSVVQGKLAGLFGLAVSGSARRQGLGRALSKAALAWGASQGATTAWLQVEADNTAARKLYDTLGFTERYRYAYRSLKA